MNRPLKIVFMGTPDYAVSSLRALHDSGHEVLAVVTQPDRPKGRGRKLTPPPVKHAAVQYGYPVLQPEKVRTHAFQEQMARLAPDLFIVVAFGQILPQRLLDIPGIGAINVHASLLPRYRGAAPIQWAIINGDRETGVTTIMMDKGMDTGDMLLMEKTEIGPDETAAELHDRLSEMGARTLIRTLERLQNGSLERVPQDHTQATYAPMLKKERWQNRLVHAGRTDRMPDPRRDPLAGRLYLQRRHAPEDLQSQRPGAGDQRPAGHHPRVLCRRASRGHRQMGHCHPGDSRGLRQTPAHRRFSLRLPPTRWHVSGIIDRGRITPPPPPDRAEPANRRP